MKAFSLGRRNCILAAMCAMVAVPAAGALGASYPDRPVRLVVPVGPAGGTDLLARELARRLSDVWGQPVVVENRAGGGGIIGAETVMKSAADGYTLLFSHDGVITATPVLYKRPDFDPIGQLAPISQVATVPYLLVVNPAVPATNVRELIAVMKEKGAKKEALGFATSALGSADHLSGERFKIAAGVEMLVVPYKNSLPAMTDVIAGHLQLGFFTIPGAQPQVKAGTLRALAITSSRRAKLFPDLPTVAETLPAFASSGAWYGVWAPVGTPVAIIEKVSADIRRSMDSPDMIAYMLNSGFETATSTPAEFAEFIRKDSAKTAQVIQSANVRLE